MHHGQPILIVYGGDLATPFVSVGDRRFRAKVTARVFGLFRDRNEGRKKKQKKTFVGDAQENEFNSQELSASWGNLGRVADRSEASEKQSQLLRSELWGCIAQR